MAGWQLGALLRELRKNRLHDWSDQVAGASDYLWDDETLVSYINEAVRRFARRSLCIRDDGTSTASAAMTQFTTVDGTLTEPQSSIYQLDPSIVAILSVKMGQDPVTGVWDNTDLARAGHSAFSTYTQPNPYFANPANLSNLPPGKPLAYGTDEGVSADANGSFSVMNLRIYPVVSTQYAGMTGYMRVIREPLTDLTLANLSAYPEIPASHHLDSIDYAAYLALSTVDTDIAGGDAAERAENFAKKFEISVEAAKKDAMRKLFAPLDFGFGRNGWSWEGN